jgi:hypothetical protein
MISMSDKTLIDHGGISVLGQQPAKVVFMIRARVPMDEHTIDGPAERT